MKISVLTVTSRELYFAEQLTSLQSQTLQDFEWIYVDEIYDKTHEKYEQLVNNTIPFIHIKPSNYLNPLFAVGAATNDGFVHCRGELIFIKNDYIIPHPECLARHWQIHEKYPRSMISGRNVELSTTPNDFANFKGVIQGHDYRMSLFQASLFPSWKIDDELYATNREGVQNWWASRNDSVPTEAIMECNGMDESFDGGYGYHDDDLAQRLMTYGLHYHIDMKSSTIQFPHERVRKTIIRSESEQQKFKDILIPQRIKDGIYRVNPHRNLRKEREECLKLLA